jgi:hypothetical protein
VYSNKQGSKLTNVFLLFILQVAKKRTVLHNMSAEASVERSDSKKASGAPSVATKKAKLNTIPEGVAEAPKQAMEDDTAVVKKKKQKAPPVEKPLSEMQVKAIEASKGGMAGWRGKKDAVEGFGCDHLALVNFQPVVTLADFEFKRKEDQYMHGTHCKGECNRPASALDWKLDKCKVTWAIVHVCNVCTAVEELMEAKKYCEWWCNKCMTKGKEAEAKMRGETSENGTRRKRTLTAV